MSVIRIKKAHRKPYVILDTTALNDARLSYRAKGLHTYLMSKPDDWSIYIEQLERESPKEGRDAIRAAMQELITAGYVRRQRLRDERGRMSGWDTTVYETPELADDEGESVTLSAKTQEHAEIGLSDFGSSENGSTEVGSTEVGSTEVGSTEVGSTEVGKSVATYYGLNQGLNPPRIESTHSPLPPIGGKQEMESCQRCDDAFAEKPKAGDYSPGFLKVWDSWPMGRRQGKALIWRIWCEQRLEARADEIAKKIEHLNFAIWRHKEMRFIPIPKTWFEQARYEDDLIPLDEAQPQPVQPRPSYVDTKRAERERERQKFVGGSDARSDRSPDVLDRPGTVIDCAEYRYEH